MSNRCLHRSSNDKVWLPTEIGVFKKHPYCVSCGVVKNISSDRGKSLGYFANVLANLKRYLESRGYKVSQAQIRLILKELKKLEADDIYSISFSKQKELFVDIAMKYIKVRRELIDGFL